MAQTKDDGSATDHGSHDILFAAKGGGILFFGNLSEYAIRFLFGIILARALGAEGLGLYTVGITIATTLAGVSILGLEAAMERFLPPALARGNDARVWGLLQVGLVLPLLVSGAAALLLFALSGFVAGHLYKNPDLMSILRWISLSIPLMVLGRMLMSSARGFKRMHYQVVAESLSFNLSRVGLTLIFLAMGLGVPGALLAYTLAWVLADVIMLILLNRLFSFRRPIRAGQRNTRDLLTFSVPVCLSLIVRRLGGDLQILLLGAITSLASVGIYSAAVRVEMVGSILLTAASTVAKPMISDLHDQGAAARLGSLYKTLTRWSLSLLLPYFVTMLLFATPILAIFGEDFEAGTPILVVLSVASVIAAGTGLSGAMIVMTGHSRLAFANTVLRTLLSIALYLILIPKLGLLGAALAGTLTGITLSLVGMVQVRRLAGLWPYSWQYLKPVAASVIALCVGAVANQLLPAGESLLFLALDIAAVWLAYVAAILVLGLSPEDRLVLTRTRQQFSAVWSWR